METILKRITDMDRQAQKLIDTARQEKLEAEQVIARQMEELRQGYLDQTRRRIQINAENERTILRQNWKRREAVYRREEERMKRAFAAHGEEWVTTLFERVVHGE